MIARTISDDIFSPIKKAIVPAATPPNKIHHSAEIR